VNARPALQQVPAGVVRAADYEAHGRGALSAAAAAYFHAQAGDGLTVAANRAAWDALALQPRVLRRLQGPQTECALLGRRWPTPLLVAPMALQRLAHSDGELASALAAAAQGVGTILSCQASVSLEQVAAVASADAGRGPLWLQLYFPPDRGALLELVARAEAAGYEALVITVDAPALAARTGLALAPGLSPVNLPAAQSAGSLRQLLATAPDWSELEWLRARTRLPILLKGVLHPADARLASSAGMAGVIVSNHGGRTLDGSVGTARALPRIVQAVGGELPVLVDGGIRSGTDVLKALALGASAVLVGRPVLWALASAGAAGVAHLLRLLRDELELAMAQCGADALGDLGPDLVARD
jgi:4-hydroxymandelate oxidase